MIKKIKLWWKSRRETLYDVAFTAEDIEQYLQKEIPMLDYMEMTDGLFMTSKDLNKIKAIVKLIPVRLQKYTKELHDCENFALEFKVIMNQLFPRLPIGIIHVDGAQGKHAMNIIVYASPSGMLRWTMIEPQTGKVSMVTSNKPYFILI